MGKLMESIQTFATEYIEGLEALVGSLDTQQIARMVALVEQAGESGKRIYAIGNGGSAATASHFVNDMGKGASLGQEKRFKIVPLTDCVPWMSALSNDLSYDDVFVEQLRNFAEPGDVVIAVSGSGNSENVLRAVRYAREAGCHTVGLAGFQGGRLKDLVDCCIVVESDHMGRIEDLHLVLLHIVCYYFMDRGEGA